VTFRAVVEHRGDAIVLELSGDLDMAAVPAAEVRLREALDRSPGRLVVDLSSVTFLDSSGIRLLLQAGAAVRDRGGELSVTRPPAGVWRMLERFRLDSRLPFTGPVPGDGEATEAAATTATEVRIELAGDLHAPGLARTAAADATGDLPDPVRDAVMLLVSEVVTNAVRHGCSGPEDQVELSVGRPGGVLRVEVRDPGHGLPHASAADDDPLRESGWGLVMVDRLASRWGIERAPSLVWFELDL
jgi:anti-anti-sigma factor